jgi:hypothetical protein
MAGQQYWGTERLRPTNAVAKVTVVMLAVAGAISVFGAFVTSSGFALMERANSGIVTDSELFAWADSLQTVANVEIIVTVITAIAFLTWEYRTVCNVPVFGLPKGPSGARALIAWFIPVVNFVLPYLDMRDVSNRMQSPTGSSRRPVLLWWIAWLGAAFVGRVSGLIQITDDGSLRTILTLEIASEVLNVVAAVLAILVVRGIQADADTRAATLHPAIARGI